MRQQYLPPVMNPPVANYQTRYSAPYIPRYTPPFNYYPQNPWRRGCQSCETPAGCGSGSYVPGVPALPPSRRVPLYSGYQYRTYPTNPIYPTSQYSSGLTPLRPIGPYQGYPTSAGYSTGGYPTYPLKPCAYGRGYPLNPSGSGGLSPVRPMPYPVGPPNFPYSSGTPNVAVGEFFILTCSGYRSW
jgi:hypothetical protein